MTVDPSRHSRPSDDIEPTHALDAQPQPETGSTRNFTPRSLDIAGDESTVGYEGAFHYLGIERRQA